MDAPTADDVRLRDFLGVLAGLTDEQIELLIEDAMCMLGTEPWSGCEDCWFRAVIFAALHLGVTGLQGHQTGPMTSASAGGLSASWAGPSSSVGLGSTNWGRQVEALAAGCGRVGPFVVVSAPACC